MVRGGGVLGLSVIGLLLLAFPGDGVASLGQYLLARTPCGRDVLKGVGKLDSIVTSGPSRRLAVNKQEEGAWFAAAVFEGFL
jgi:hypothetical protein